MLRGKVLINGAGGFLGSHTVEAFVDAGYDCRITDLPGVALDWARPLGVEIAPADLSDFSQACAVTAGVRGIVNVVGVFDFSRSYDFLYRGNVTATEHMCRAALEAGVDKFVHIASVAVYGTPAYTPMGEDGPKNPKNHYETTKMLGEEVVFRYQQRHGLPATSLRPAPIYGPRSRYIHNLMFATTCLMAASRKAQGMAFSDSARCHHVHVEDVARASVLLMQLPRSVGHAYNCADCTPIKWHQLFDVMADLVGLENRRVVPWFPPLMNRLLPLLVSLWPEASLAATSKRMGRAWDKLVERHDLEHALSPRLDRDMLGYMAGDHVYDTSALRNLGFRWRHPHIVDGLRATHGWLVDNGWIPAPTALARAA